jgi:hypothetical protein
MRVPMHAATKLTLISARDARRKRARRWGVVIALASLAVEVAALRRRGYRAGGRVVARCRSGHLFTTLWLPGASVKALRMGPWRVQRCPVGRHWSLVALVDRAELAPEELAQARAQRAVRIP